MVPAEDRKLVQIVDSSLADASRRAEKPDGSSWLACRPGCTPCCHGVFRISMLDAERLRAGMGVLLALDPARAVAVADRAQVLVQTLTVGFPGDMATGTLDAEEAETWQEFEDRPEADAACPALDPVSGRCDLYAYRPLTCRVFGPPVRNREGIGLCELCYVGATEIEILAGEMHLNHVELETELERELPPGETLIAWVLRRA